MRCNGASTIAPGSTRCATLPWRRVGGGDGSISGVILLRHWRRACGGPATIRPSPTAALMQQPAAAWNRCMPRIAIVTPGQIGSNPRVVKEAEALHEAGYTTTVIATRALDL